MNISDHITRPLALSAAGGALCAFAGLTATTAPAASLALAIIGGPLTGLSHVAYLRQHGQRPTLLSTLVAAATAVAVFMFGVTAAPVVAGAQDLGECTSFVVQNTSGDHTNRNLVVRVTDNGDTVRQETSNTYTEVIGHSPDTRPPFDIVDGHRYLVRWIAGPDTDFVNSTDNVPAPDGNLYWSDFTSALAELNGDWVAIDHDRHGSVSARCATHATPPSTTTTVQATTTTTAPPTATTVQATTTTAPAPGPNAPTLPATGASTDVLIAVAAVAIVTGLLLVAFVGARRRTIRQALDTAHSTASAVMQILNHADLSGAPVLSDARRNLRARYCDLLIDALIAETNGDYAAMQTATSRFTAVVAQATELTERAHIDTGDTK